MIYVEDIDFAKEDKKHMMTIKWVNPFEFAHTIGCIQRLDISKLNKDDINVSVEKKRQQNNQMIDVKQQYYHLYEINSWLSCQNRGPRIPR